MTSAQLRALDELLPRYAVTGETLARSTLRRAPVVLEVGIGNGENLLAMAARDPGSDYLGSDVHRPGLGHTLLGIERLSLSNLRVYDGDVFDLLAILPAASLSAVHIYFPDPWPKKRHHKRRLLGADLLLQLAPLLRRGARVYFATDNADYASAARAQFEAHSEWRNLAGAGRWALRPRHRIVTRFESRAGRAGTSVYELAFAWLGPASPVNSMNEARQ